MRTLVVLVFALLGTACHAQFRVENPKIADTAWVHDGSEAPHMCIRFLRDGSVKFTGGYHYFQPASWSGDASLVTIRLGGKAAFPMESAAYQKQFRPKSLRSFDPAKRELVYDMLGHYDSFDFLGLIFFREKSCGKA